MAVCKNCHCVKSKQPCTSCYPSRKNNCSNVARSNTTPTISQNSLASNTPQIVNAQSDENLSISSILNDVITSKISVLNRVPRGARNQAAAALSSAIRCACDSTSSTDWQKLFRFSSICLRKPKRGGKRRPSLTSVVLNNISIYVSDPLAPLVSSDRGTSHTSESEEVRAKLAGKKIASGDIKGAIRVLSSNDSILPFDESTLSILKTKHPSRHPDCNMPDCPSDENVANALQLSEEQVRRAVLSFPGGSAGGSDLLLPQHLKDMISKSSGDGGTRLLSSLTGLCNKMLRGEIPKHITPILYGATLLAFSKPHGGVRPIAIGGTLRRLVAKAAAFYLKSETKTKLFPFQLGVSIPSGAEAIVHSARSFCTSKKQSPDPIAFLKVDFENAFNTIRRDKLLKVMKKDFECVFPFLYQCYSEESILNFNGTRLESAEGIQQGDPLGPLCFSLCLQGLISRLSSTFNVWYLDDGTLAGDPSIVESDFKKIIEEQDSLGLRVNIKKCELSVLGSDSAKNDAVALSFANNFPNISIVPAEDIHLLGTPLFPEGIDKEISSRSHSFKLLCSRLERLDHHEALFLLKNAFFIPKFLYILRTFLCHDNRLLNEIDFRMKACLESITNCRFDDPTFRQASLPIKLGGLGVRRSKDLALPAFISSSLKCSAMVDQLLSKTDSDPFRSLVSDTIIVWKAQDARLAEPLAEAQFCQRSWDLPLAKLHLADLIASASDPCNKGRLLAVSSPNAGEWLNAVPICPLGLKLDNDSLRIAVALRLGVEMAMPYTCICGTFVERKAVHGLDCRKSGGRHVRHSAVNDIVHRALQAAGVPSQLEPNGLSRDDGKRPDGATIIPFSKGKCLVWDVTCVNTLAASHIKSAASQAGAPSEAAELKKHKKYASLSEQYIFTPVALETLGSWGPEASTFVSELGRRLEVATGEPRAASFLRQKISIAVQRGNAVCIRQSLPNGTGLNELFYI